MASFLTLLIIVCRKMGWSRFWVFLILVKSSNIVWRLPCFADLIVKLMYAIQCSKSPYGLLTLLFCPQLHIHKLIKNAILLVPLWWERYIYVFLLLSHEVIHRCQLSLPSCVTPPHQWNGSVQETFFFFFPLTGDLIRVVWPSMCGWNDSWRDNSKVLDIQKNLSRRTTLLLKLSHQPEVQTISSKTGNNTGGGVLECMCWM